MTMNYDHASTIHGGKRRQGPRGPSMDTDKDMDGKNGTDEIK